MAWVEKRGQHSWRVRYFTDDGSIASISGFPTKTAAEEEANTIESDQRRGTWTDPAAGQTLLAEWVEEWLDALDVGQRTEENYRSKLRAQILPRWGDTALAAITSTKVHAWAKTLRHSGLADVTVTDTVKLLSLILADAAVVVVSASLRRCGPPRNRWSRSPTRPPPTTAPAPAS